MAWFRWDGPDLILELRVQPNARRCGFVLEPGAAGLKVRIAAPAVEGRANEALTTFLAEAFGVPKSRVRLERGAGGRRKRLRICSPGRLPPELALAGGGPGRTPPGTGFA
jgi:uncharacterized protein (TIGR00251 family)